MNKKTKEKKIEISVESLIALRDILSDMDLTKFNNIKINSMSIYDYDRIRADAIYSDYSNYWLKLSRAFHALLSSSDVVEFEYDEEYNCVDNLDALLLLRD